jgi:hypothetical protein
MTTDRNLNLFRTRAGHLIKVGDTVKISVAPESILCSIILNSPRQRVGTVSEIIWHEFNDEPTAYFIGALEGLWCHWIENLQPA